MINEEKNEESEGSQASQKNSHSSSDSFDNPLDMNVVSTAELKRQD